MSEYAEKTKIYMTRSMMIKYLDPFDKKPFLCQKTNSDLISIMFEFSTSFIKYKFTDYEFEKHQSNSYQEIRSPDPVIRERLIDSDQVMQQNIRYYSQESEAERYNKELRRKQEEDRMIEEALKKSIEDENERLRLEEENRNSPNYEKLMTIHKDLTPEICDYLYQLLKERKFDEFRKKIPENVVTVVLRLKNLEGEELRSLLLSKKDPHKCFH